MSYAVHSRLCVLPTTEAPSRERIPCPCEGPGPPPKRPRRARGSDPTTLRLEIRDQMTALAASGVPFPLTPSSGEAWTVDRLAGTIRVTADPHSDIFVDPERAPPSTRSPCSTPRRCWGSHLPATSSSAPA